MNEFPRRLTAERGENRCPSQKGVRMSRNVGPEGKALETVRIPQVPAAVGGGGESTWGTRLDAQTQSTLVRPCCHS